MFSVSIKDDVTFNNFLNSGEQDYVDVYLNDEVAIFVMNSSDLFSVITLPCSHTPNEHAYGFRMSRNLLKQQKRANTIAIRVSDSGDVSTSFLLNNELLCEADFIYQKVYSTAYADKLNLLRGFTKPSGIQLGTLTPLIKLSSNLGGLLNIESGVASAIFQNGVRVYKKMHYDEVLCITPKYAQLLQKCDTNIFAIENYVGAFKDDFAILVTKLRVASNAEFLSLENSRNQYKATIDFTNLVIFASSHPMKIANFVINLDTKLCELVENEISYKIPVTITDEVRAHSDKYHELIVPFSLIRNVLTTLGSTTVKMEKKQYFIRMDTEGYTILFN